MITVALPAFKEHPDTYLRKVEAGEDLLICGAASELLSSGALGLRPIALCNGQFEVPDDFNDPLPEDLQRLFDGGDE